MPSSPEMTSIDPVSPVAPWQGGKRCLARRITAAIEAIPHTTYAEPFLGMGGVFLRRRLVPKCEIVNDRSRDVANLFRILQRHYPQFIECLRFQITTRVEFDRLAATPPDTLTDLERAARFLYLQRAAFGGKLEGRSFGVSRDRPARFNLTALQPMLEDLHARLAGVTVECMDWHPFMLRYDGPGTLFYIDPPYFGSEGAYGDDLFQRGDFARLAECLSTLRGRFLLSINDTPEARETFGRFQLTPVLTRYSISGGKAAAVARPELLVTNAPSMPLENP